jgi:hypothetical protein
MLDGMKTWDEIAEAVRTRVGALDADCVSGRDAARAAEVTAEISRLLEAAKALYARRAVDSGAWRRVSHAASAEQWLATISGSSETVAREALVTAERVRDLPATAERLKEGTLSMTQAAQVAAGAAANPNSERHLLAVAGRAGMRALRAEKDRVIAAVTDERRAYEAAVRDRHLRSWTRGHATHGSFSGPTQEVAKLLDALEPLQRKAFEKARAEQGHESHDAYRFDALIELATQNARPAGSKQARPIVRVRVDAAALHRGHTDAGEVCEIPGLGPVPVAYAREVLREGLLELVISEGVDVRTVVSTTRHVPPALRIAIDERDQGRCKVRECDHTLRTERHHTMPFATHGVTSYDVLGDVCPQHHHLIHDLGHSVIDNGDGTWSLQPPKRDTNAA